MCEEFNVLPAVALEALENDFCGLIFRVMDTRDYAKSFTAFKEDLKIVDVNQRRRGAGIDRVRNTWWKLQKEKHDISKADKT